MSKDSAPGRSPSVQSEGPQRNAVVKKEGTKPMRYAIVDVGSNSARMAVYQVEPGSTDFVNLYTQRQMLSLLSFLEGDRFRQAGVETAVRCLREFQQAAQEQKADSLHCFATAAFRRMSNQREVLNQIAVQTGISLQVLDGATEALYAYRGNLGPIRTQNADLLIDMGGGSTELIDCADPSLRQSLPFGSLSLYRQFVSGTLPTEAEAGEIEKYVAELVKSTGFTEKSYPSLILIGGTGRAIGKTMERLLHPDRKQPGSFHGYSAALKELEEALSLFPTDSRLAEETILQIDADRLKTLLPGLAAYRALFAAVGCRRFYISDLGLREGYLYSLLRGEMV